MSQINKLPFNLKILSKELQISSVPYSGWPPPRTIPPLNETKSKKSSSITGVFDINSTSIVIDENQKRSIRKNYKSYFEKLRSVNEDRRTNDPISVRDQSDDILENLIESIQSSNTWDLPDRKNNRSKTERLLSQLDFLKEMCINKSIPTETKQQHVYKTSFSVITTDGSIIFDFSKQSINYNIYVQLMQLIRLSNLDKIIEKMFHQSGKMTYNVKYLNKFNIFRWIS